MSVIIKHPYTLEQKINCYVSDCNQAVVCSIYRVTEKRKGLLFLCETHRKQYIDALLLCWMAQFSLKQNHNLLHGQSIQRNSFRGKEGGQKHHVNDVADGDADKIIEEVESIVYANTKAH